MQCVPATFKRIMHTPSPPIEVRLHDDYAEITDEFMDVRRRVPIMTGLEAKDAPYTVPQSPHLGRIMSFPAGIQKSFSQWQVAAAPATINDRDAQILQGTNPGQLPVNLYFDDSGLLVRSVRWSSTPVGTVPTQTDYADYREVAGVKMPFRVVVTWTNGQNTIALKEVRPNVPIDATRFATPAPFQRK